MRKKKGCRVRDRQEQIAEREEALLEAERLKELGTIEEQQSRYGEALKCYGAALEIFRAHANRTGEGKVLGNLGLVYRAQEQYELAIAHHTQALAIAREIGEKRSEGINLGNLGDALFKLEQFDEAETAFREAFAVCDEAIPAGAGAFRGSLALLLAQQGKIAEARDLLEVGEPQVESYPEEHAKFLCKKGQVCQLVGDADGARAARKQAQGIVAELKVTEDSEVGQAVAELVVEVVHSKYQHQKSLQHHLVVVVVVVVVVMKMK